MQISGNVETLNFLLVLQKIKRKLVRVKIIEKTFSLLSVTQNSNSSSKSTLSPTTEESKANQVLAHGLLAK